MKTISIDTTARRETNYTVPWLLRLLSWIKNNAVDKVLVTGRQWLRSTRLLPATWPIIKATYRKSGYNIEIEKKDDKYQAVIGRNLAECKEDETEQKVYVLSYIHFETQSDRAIL